MRLYRLGEFGIRQNDPSNTFMKKGEVIEGHKHNFDHLTAVWGHMLIEVLDDEGKVLRSAEFGEHLGRPIALILAGTIHRLTALNDRTCYRCIYFSRNADGEPQLDWSGESSKDFV
jgi:hypothetical protein